MERFSNVSGAVNQRHHRLLRNGQGHAILGPSLCFFLKDSMFASSRNTSLNRLTSIAGQFRTVSTQATMKEAIVGKGPKVEIIDSPIPKPGPDQVVTKIIFSGSNPKDCKSS